MSDSAPVGGPSELREVLLRTRPPLLLTRRLGKIMLRPGFKPFTGVGMPWRRPSSTTLPSHHGSSSRLPRSRSFPIEVVWCGGVERIIASVLSMMPGGSFTSSARPTATVSRKAASRRANRSGSSRYFPSDSRVSALSPLSGTSKMNFSQPGP